MVTVTLRRLVGQDSAIDPFATRNMVEVQRTVALPIVPRVGDEIFYGDGDSADVTSVQLCDGIEGATAWVDAFVVDTASEIPEAVEALCRDYGWHVTKQ